MTHNETHIVTLTKFTQRNLQEKVITSNLANIVNSVNTKSLKVMGWTIDAGSASAEGAPLQAWRQEPAPADTNAEYLYSMVLLVSYSNDAKKADTLALPAIVNNIRTRAAQPVYGRWTVSLVDGKEYVPPAEGELATGVNADLVGYTSVDIPEDWDENFSHLYGLDAQITRVRKALEAGIQSDWSNRFHCALVGPPGCGKSDICRSIKAALGADAVMEFDATATTAAGAIKELSEREILPRVLVVEEIEKADEKALTFLLALCDLRGEIRKTTAKTNIQRDTKLFVIATVNNVPLFRKLQAGALASRFSANTIWFKHPSRDLLVRILTREVDKVKGDQRWIPETLNYCEEQGITDPRAIIGLCLCGGADWLTGDFQKMMAATQEPEGADLNEEEMAF